MDIDRMMQALSYLCLYLLRIWYIYVTTLPLHSKSVVPSGSHLDKVADFMSQVVYKGARLLT
jgi:hypothetical protein